MNACLVTPGAVSGSVKSLVLCGLVGALLMAPTALAHAQEQGTPMVAAAIAAVPADADVYRMQGARHLYELYGQRVFKGQLPPLLYAIAVIDIEIDEDGSVVDAVVTREPASAKEVLPWILGLIKGASPFPKPRGPGRTHYQDVWLVDHTYTFQLHTLTEGQR